MKKNIILLLLCFGFQLGFGQSNAKRALFIGNSYTFYNDMPNLVKSCALSTGDTLDTDQSTVSGYTWNNHVNNPTTISKIKQGGFDYVVLQANSLEFTYSDNTVANNTLPYGYYLDSLAHKYNSCAQTIFYNTWGRKNGSNGQTYLQQDTLIEKRYKALADLKSAMVSPVGPVRRYLRTNNPGIELYVADESHPTAAGSYVSAVCFYTVMFRKDPTLITYNFSLSAADANAIKLAAKAILYNNLSSWNVGTFDPAAPVADFSFAGNTETNIILTNNSLNANTYNWKFGDNTTSSLATPSHTYSVSGTYNVSLTASYCKLNSTITKSVTVSSVKPIITNVAQSPLYVFPSNTVAVSATITDNISVTSAKMYWGTASGSLTNTVTLSASGNTYSGTIPAKAAGTTIFYSIEAKDGSGNTTTTTEFSYKVQDVIITITPSPVILNRGATQQFTATATDLNGNAVAFTPTWSASAGSITSTGLYTAPPTAGNYTITAVQAGVNGTGVAAVTISPVPVIAGQIEAEKYVSMSGVQNEGITDTGDGLDVAYIDANDWMTYDVNVAKTGTYQVDFRVASTIANVQMELFSGTTSLGVLTVPTATGGWQTWQTFSMNVNLTQGIQTLKFVAKTGGFNLNWMNFTEVSIPLSIEFGNQNSSSTQLQEKILTSPNPFGSHTSLRFATVKERSVCIYSSQGDLKAQFISSGDTIEFGEELRPGIYFVKISERDGYNFLTVEKY